MILSSISSDDMANLIVETLDENKAEEIVLLPLVGKSDMAHAMIVASGRSARHVGALADFVVEKLRERGVRPGLEGVPSNDWVLLDAGDIIVHLFRPEVRTYYNLEKMWGPAIAQAAVEAEPVPAVPAEVLDDQSA